MTRIKINADLFWIESSGWTVAVCVEAQMPASKAKVANIPFIFSSCISQVYSIGGWPRFAYSVRDPEPAAPRFATFEAWAFLMWVTHPKRRVLCDV